MRRVAMLLVCLVGAVALVGLSRVAADVGRPEVAVTLSGVTVDPAGQAIPGVSVELRQGTAASRRTVTDPQGQ